MIEGLIAALSLSNIAAAVLGVFLGIIIGAIPGLTATFGIVLLVPVTFIMSTDHGMIMLVGIYAGAIYGGSISAILLNIPGTPASIISGWEGYAMAKRGEAPQALGISAVGSGIGGMIAAVALVFMTPVLAQLALRFGAPEYVMLVIFSLVVVVVMMETPLLSNLASVFIGLSIAAIGISPVDGAARMTFGFYNLYSGLGVVAVLIGFFCLPQALQLAIEAIRGENAVGAGKVGASSVAKVWKRVIYDRWLLLRSSTLGVGIGVLPAIGPESTPFVAHSLERRISAHPEEFGKGSQSGLFAAEASASANIGGSLIPLLSLGIPGSAAAAVFIGALTLHGLQPGPLLFTEQPGLMYSFFTGYFVVNLLVVVMGFFCSRYMAALLRLPKAMIAAYVTLFSFFGAYAVNNSMFDIWVMIGALVLVIAMRAATIPVIPSVLGFILGGLLETNIAIAMARSTELSYYLQRPIALGLAIISVTIVIWTIWRRLRSGPGAVSSTGNGKGSLLETGD
ncbi:tripartite tricarboxylate transporter permease [Billgrantia endophytica]|uniref:C4-dicarboxylate ABC transporter permease n=1 Tax=Billgrantia endophytica TaxID=2033802 RepID=A0A2N7U2W5_9GAMM|nr:tripartite tricarboxylate transporter permease [Halomonas endophytica]PMR74772.1 C4-dicarboxylate ABC transporter permease [Halomonas endophytica]